jgi:predicted amidohydrolase
MRVALAQIDCVLGDTEENLRRAKVKIAEAWSSLRLATHPLCM